MRFRLLLFFNSILLLNTISCEEEIKPRVLNRNDYEAFPSIEQQTIQEYSNDTSADAAFDEVIDEIINSSRQGRNLEGLDDVYSDPTVKQALLSGDDTQARNLIRDKLCNLGLMECERAPARIIYSKPPPQAYYNQRPGARPPPPQPQSFGGYGPARPVPVPHGPPQQQQQQPPRKVGYAPPSSLNSFHASKPLGPIHDKYSTDFYEVDSAPSSIKFGYTEKPTIIVNQGKREAVSQNHHVHHHYVHVDGNAPAVVDGTKTVLVNTPISEYSAVNSLSGSYQTNGFSSHGAENSGYNGNSGFSGSSGFSPSATDFEYKGVNSGVAPGIYGGSSTNVKPVFESNNQYASGSGYNQQGYQQQNFQSNTGPATFSEGNNGLYNVGSSYHASQPDIYKKELNINGNRGNSLSGLSQYSQQNYLGGSNQQQFNKYSKNQYNQGEQYQGFESARQDQYDCVCVPFDQCPAYDVVGRRDDLILPLDPRHLSSEIEADTDNSTVSRVTKDVAANNATETHKIAKRAANDVEKVQGEGSTPAQAPGTNAGSEQVSFPSSRRRRDTDQVVPASIEKKENLASVEEDIKDGEGRALSAEKRQAFYQQPKQCGPRAVCCRKPNRPQPIQQQPQQQNYNRCGVRNAQGINGRVKTPAYTDGNSEFGEYPWQAAILKKDPKESVYVCGGTLIDNQHIATAAHCVKTYSGFDLRVRLGEWDVNHDVEFYPYVERDVISVHIHPEYYAGTLDNDLAILKLNQPVDFSGTPHISPACLPDKFTDFTGQRCWTTGWGKDNWEYGKYQNILKEVDVPIINQNVCQQQLRATRLGYSYNLKPGFICAGGEEGKDACKGDGGGPLVCERNGVWQVAGIVSWGIGCGKANVPGVYVRVSHYLDWIAQITQRY